MSDHEPLNLDEVRDSLRKRLEYIEEQMAPLQGEADEIRALLGERSVSPARGTTRLGGEELREALLAAVAKEPGKSGAHYAGEVGVAPPAAARELKALEAAGKLRREGAKRGTRWMLP